MKFFAILCCVGFTQAFLVRREADAEAEADADADAGYGYGAVGAVVAPAAVSAPKCVSVPVKTCVPRQVEHPKKVCHQEVDTIVDTVITEHCETVETKTCTQSQSHSSHTSAIVGTDSKVVSAGVIATPEVVVAGGVVGYGAVGAVGAVGHGVVAGYGAVGHRVVGAVGHGVVGAVGHGVVGAAHVGYGKREADAEAEADADAGYGYATLGHSAVSAPRCTVVPVTKCTKVPIDTPRKISKTLCKVVTDITLLEDCTETITTKCEQQSVTVSHGSAVVGHDTQVGPSAIVATHGHAALAVAAPAVAVAGYAGYAAHGAIAGGSIAHGAPLVARHAGTGYGLAGGYGRW